MTYFLDWSIVALVLGLGACGVGIAWKLIQHREVLEKQYIAQDKKAKDPANQIDQLLDNLPAITEDRQKLYDQAVAANGENDPLAKSLKQQLDLLKMAGSIPEPVLHLLKPIAMRAIKAVSGFKL